MEREEAAMGQVLINVKWDDISDSQKTSTHQAFKTIATAMGMSMSEAIIQAMAEFNITHQSALSDIKYKIPEK